jgi:hypothetical protein
MAVMVGHVFDVIIIIYVSMPIVSALVYHISAQEYTADMTFKTTGYIRKDHQ